MLQLWQGRQVVDMVNYIGKINLSNRFEKDLLEQKHSCFSMAIVLIFHTMVDNN